MALGVGSEVVDVEQVATVPRALRIPCRAVVRVDSTGGSFVSLVELRSRRGEILYTTRHQAGAGSAVEAALWGAYHAHSAAHTLGVRSLDVYLSEPDAVDILARRTQAPEGASKAFFWARTSARKLSRVNYHEISDAIRDEMRQLVLTREPVLPPTSTRTLSLFGGETAA